MLVEDEGLPATSSRASPVASCLDAMLRLAIVLGESNEWAAFAEAPALVRADENPTRLPRNPADGFPCADAVGEVEMLSNSKFLVERGDMD